MFESHYSIEKMAFEYGRDRRTRRHNGFRNKNAGINSALMEFSVHDRKNISSDPDTVSSSTILIAAEKP
ncbi:MAG: hypothetical protein ISR78_06095 [Spirochaetia bacterium]|nr:hypothetical protein [Spirochaetia bacterium]